jgi:transposase
MEFRELSDSEWELIKPLLPPRARVGRPRADNRMVLNGILYVLLTGCRWMDMPIRHGHYSTAFRRLKRWQGEGVWSRMLEALMGMGHSKGKLCPEVVAVDGTTIEAGKGEGEMVGYDGHRHRKGSKVHVAVTAESLPLSIVIGPGDEHDGMRLVEVVDGIRVKRGIGRPISRPEEVYADSAYDSRRVRAYLRLRGIKAKANIPLNPRNRRKPKKAWKTIRVRWGSL